MLPGVYRLARGECALVQLATTQPCRVGDLSRRLLQPSTLRNEPKHLGDTVRETGGRWLSSGNDETDFTASAFGKIRCKLGGGSPTNLLMQLGEFAADDGTAIGSEGCCKIGESSRKTIGRLEEDHRSRLASKGREIGHPTLTRKKALKSETVSRKPANSERSQNSARPGQNRHSDSGRRRSRNERKPGIADSRHASIRKHENITLASEFHDLCGTSILIVFMKRNQSRPILDAKSAEKVNGCSGVFCGDDLDGSKCVDKTTRNITEIANRGGRQDDHGSLSHWLADVQRAMTASSRVRSGQAQRNVHHRTARAWDDLRSRIVSIAG